MAVVLLVLPVSAQAELPEATKLSRGWEMRPEPSARGHPVEASRGWRPVRVPSVFDARAIPRLYQGEVRRYRLRFRAPRMRPGFGALIVFEGVRRRSVVYLNGRQIGGNREAYTPFAVEARGLRQGRPNRLTVLVDNRKEPGVPEGWWNWGGIVRPVRLVPVGRAYLRDIGTMSRVRCRGRSRRCKAELLVDAVLERRGRRGLQPRVQVRLRSPSGRLLKRSFALPPPHRRHGRVRLALPVPAPELWSPERPALYSASIVLRDRGEVVQVERRQVGLRSVEVKRGRVYLNNRLIELRGASIHEDMPGHGAALTEGDMSTIVGDLQALGANVTRSHYLMNDRLLTRLDRAGILVWSQAPIWQRDLGVDLGRRGERRSALLTVGRTVTAARSHPSVLTHSVANELSPQPDRSTGTAHFLMQAQRRVRRLDPTLPVSLDISSHSGIPRQTAYRRFDLIGFNQYYGWYSWVRNFDLLEPYIRQLRDLYPGHAIVMTEWGAEARPELAKEPVERKGSYRFQAMHAQRTLDVIDRSTALSGAIYWTLREFEIYPGWTGGAGRRPSQYEPNTRHHKGLVSYAGERKPAFQVVRDRYLSTTRHP